ncbi:hypothetical protein CR492_09355 [Methylocella silvestris]|uniref:Uncharacterized protein n=1 Tax=Methylocella silvestris TaxID=199596 RepID=A0A2J7THR9_METSI|nr:hypothetical protein CR492_09355 [Methylocella silvestris]
MRLSIFGDSASPRSRFPDRPPPHKKAFYFRRDFRRHSGWLRWSALGLPRRDRFSRRRKRCGALFVPC